MIVEYSYTRKYLLGALAAAPSLFDFLLQGITDEEADARPDAERFTIREVMAHLADWDKIFLERMRRICDEERPLLPGFDEGQRAIDNHYARTDVTEQCALFRERRAQLVQFLQNVQPGQWSREGDRPEIGVLTLEGLALLIPLHDTYHYEQVASVRAGCRS